MEPARALRRDAHLHLADYTVAGAMTATAVIALATHLDIDAVGPQPEVATSVVRWVATIGVCVALVGRRRWPLPCFAMIVALLFLLGVTDSGDTVAYLAMLIALYSAAESLPLQRASLAGAMVLALVAANRVLLDNDPTTGLVGAAAAFGLGRLIRQRRRRQDDEADDAQRRAQAAIEVADLDAAEERQRTAQELHDVIAHSLSVIAVRAGIGAHLIDREPDEAARALDAIRTATATAADELDRLIALLRDGNPAETEPPPSLLDIDTLCRRVANADLTVDLVSVGDLHSPTAGVSLAAYRIVQEALTNVVRHAGPAAVSVHISVAADHIDITVTDTGNGAAIPPEPARRDGGRGLIGMTERAELYGGTLTAAPHADGGFRVHAVLRSTFDGAAQHPIVHMEPVRTETPFHRHTDIPTVVWDVGLAVLFAGFAVVELLDGRSPTSTSPGQIGFQPTDRWAWLLKIGCCLTLVARRRYPAMTLLTSTLFGVALTLGDYDTGIIVAVFIVGLYTVGNYASTRRLIAALVGIVVTMSIVAASDPPDLDVPGAVFTGAVAAAAAIAGYMVRRDRERRDARTADHHTTGADEARRARLVATNERLRIAEELDRVINRSIASIAAIADTGTRSIATDPAEALATLETISTTSRDALGELRRVLTRMHHDDDGIPHAPTTPADRTRASTRT